MPTKTEPGTAPASTAEILLQPEPWATALLDELPGNPRLGNDEAVARSYAEFGQVKPIVVRRKGKSKRATVIAGNTQLRAARDILGWGEMTVVLVPSSWSDEKAAAFALADNRTSELGEMDDELLLAAIEAVESEALRAATGYDDQYIVELRDLVRPPSPVPGIDEIPVPQGPTRSKRGDVWLLGHHRVMCGDATVPEDVDTLMAERTAAMIWTDPPYGVAYQTKMTTEEATARNRRQDGLIVENDDLSAGDLRQLLRASLTNGLHHTKKGGCVFVASPGGPQMMDFGAVLVELDLYRETLIWVKDVFVFGRQDYHWRHETIFFGWKPGAAHQVAPDRTQDTVWEIPRPKRSEEHPTMKPVELITRAMLNHTKPNALVLDPFGGSGSTLMAAEVTGRKAHLMELAPHYCDVICLRWQLETGGKPVRESDGVPVDFES